MKKLKFYILKNNNQNEALKIWQNNKNSLIYFENNKFYFQSKFKNKVEEIMVNYEKLDINEDLLKTCSFILNFSLLEAETISKEPIGFEQPKDSIIFGIEQVLNKFFYEKNLDIFDLFTNILIKLLMSHYLTNGNKRLTLCFLKNFLIEMGYYLTFTNGLWKDFSKHKSIFEEFVIKLENKEKFKNKEKFEKVYQEIKKWIQNNSFIDLNWRK